MAINTHQTFQLDLTPGGASPIIHASQGDIGRDFTVVIYNGGYSLPADCDVVIRGKKPDKTVFEYTVTYDDDTDEVEFETTEQMTIISGPVECELVFSNDGDIIASANFVLMVEDSPYNPDALSESDIPTIGDLIEQTIGGDIRDEVDALITENPELMLQDNAVTTPKLADEAVTVAKVSANIQTVFNNVSDMKQSAELRAGMYVSTMGYYSINDGGGADYYITNSNSKAYTHYETLTGNLYAELLVYDAVNIKSLGAKGDGTAADAYLNEAIVISKRDYTTTNPWDIWGAYNTVPIFIPAGRYGITQTINVPDFITIKGAGKTSSKLLPSITDGSPVISVGTTSAGSKNITLEDFSILGEGKNCTGLFIHSQRTNIRNVAIYYCTKCGVDAYDSIITRLNNCEIVYCGNTSDYAIKLDGTAQGGYGCHDFIIDGCNIDNSTEWFGNNKGVHIIRGSNVVITNTCMQGWETAVTIERTARASIVNSYFEKNSTTFNGELYGANIKDNYITDTDHILITDMLKGVSFTGNNFAADTNYSSYIEPAGTISECLYNYVANNFVSGYLSDISAAYKTKFETVEGNFFKEQGGKITSYDELHYLRGSIGDAVDLDDFKTACTYLITNTASTNLPIAAQGVLEVLTLDPYTIIQRYSIITGNNTNQVYMRTRWYGTFRAWTKISDT